MEKFGKAIVKARRWIVALSVLLLIPAAIGFIRTRINYDILYYLPKEIETMKGQDVLMDDSVDLNEIALATSGAVGSDLANMINEAAINAVKEGRNLVSQKDLFNAVEQVLVGKEKKDRIMSAEERKIVSYHEVGHALIAALQKNSEPVQKITIVPRTMGALGYVMQVPEEEKYLNTQAELHDMLVGLLGGRAAEEIVFDTVTTGAANDIEKATSIARSMVTQYGMTKRFGLMGLETVESRYLDGRLALNCSDVTAADIDNEVMKILKDCYKEAKKLLKENRDLMDKLAGYLIKKETITGKEFMKIYRKAKGLPEPKDDDDSEKGGRIKEKQKKQDKTEEQSALSLSVDDYLKELEENGGIPDIAEETPAHTDDPIQPDDTEEAEAMEQSAEPKTRQDVEAQIKKSFQAVVDDKISVTKTETIEYEPREDTETGTYSAPDTDDDKDEGSGSDNGSLPTGGVFSGQK